MLCFRYFLRAEETEDTEQGLDEEAEEKEKMFKVELFVLLCLHSINHKLNLNLFLLFALSMQ